jgi:hypothetical protein
MKHDERDLLEVLKFELEFVEKGGYGRSPRDRWRAPQIFEDSPACMNYDSKDNPAPCGECVLMELVPPEFRTGKVPCRHIRLNAAGDTLDSLYRHADDREIEEKYLSWLRNTIALLGNRRPLAPAMPRMPEEEAAAALAMHETMHPKCANPACPLAFHWLAGGKFFRFRTSSGQMETTEAPLPAPPTQHGMRHYWLCQNCSQVFTLTYEPPHGVVIRTRWQELPAHEREVSAT